MRSRCPEIFTAMLRNLSVIVEKICNLLRRAKANQARNDPQAMPSTAQLLNLFAVWAPLLVLPMHNSWPCADRSCNAPLFCDALHGCDGQSVRTSGEGMTPFPEFCQAVRDFLRCPIRKQQLDDKKHDSLRCFLHDSATSPTRRC